VKDETNILKHVKENFLFHAISFISIVDVCEKNNYDGSINLYIKTNNLESVEMENLKLLSERLSVDGVDVQVIKADENIIGNSFEKNTDTISVYIE
jgi:hypothetical protein